MNQTDPKLVTSGELARLANTTKRTIHHYANMGILRPIRTNSKGYRFYEERQVLDFQMILLLTTLGVPLGDIKRFLRSGKKKLPELFGRKQTDIGRQIRELQFHFANLEQYQKNLQTNGTLVAPKIITLKPFGVYYIERVGAYAQIEKFCEELKGMFEPTTYPNSSHLRGGRLSRSKASSHTRCGVASNATILPEAGLTPGVEDGDLTTLAIFHNPTYQPKKSPIWIGVLANPRSPASLTSEVKSASTSEVQYPQKLRIPPTSEVEGSLQGETSEVKLSNSFLRGGGASSGRHLGSKIKVKPEFQNQVKFLTFAPGKVITYTHHGAGKLLSLFWKELEKYCELNKLKVRKNVPDFEIYRKPDSDPTHQLFEIYLPVK